MWSNQAKEVAGNIGARAYYECSALRNEGVDVSVQSVAIVVDGVSEG